MKFRDVKNKAVQCLSTEAYDHEVRGNIDVKNLFATGQIEKQVVMELITHTRGDQYNCSPHHQDSSVDVHILRPFRWGCRWYVKFYFIEPDMIFISVHKSVVEE